MYNNILFNHCLVESGSDLKIQAKSFKSKSFDGSILKSEPMSTAETHRAVQNFELVTIYSIKIPPTCLTNLPNT